jgi:HTH-type transcriptional regulator/antitoxin HipB
MNLNIISDTGQGAEAVYLYYLPSQKDGEIFPCKIGHSKSPESRVQGICSALQEPPNVHIFRVPNGFWAEQKIHFALNLKGRSFGNGGREWFVTNPAEVSEMIQTPYWWECESIRTMRSLGEAIRWHRKMSGFTQSDISRRTNMRVATISALERSNGNATVNTVFQALWALDLQIKIEPDKNKYDENNL